MLKININSRNRNHPVLDSCFPQNVQLVVLVVFPVNLNPHLHKSELMYAMHLQLQNRPQ